MDYLERTVKNLVIYDSENNEIMILNGEGFIDEDIEILFMEYDCKEGIGLLCENYLEESCFILGYL